VKPNPDQLESFDSLKRRIESALEESSELTLDQQDDLLEFVLDQLMDAMDTVDEIREEGRE